MPQSRRSRPLHVSVSPWQSSRVNVPAQATQPPSDDVTTLQSSPERDEGPNEAPLKSLARPDNVETLDPLEGVAEFVTIDDGSTIFGRLLVSAGLVLSVSGSVVMDRMECQQSDEWALCLVRVRNHANGATLELLVERTEGDSMRLQPPSDPALLPLGGFSDNISGMPRLDFTPRCLKSEGDADAFMAKFHPNVTYDSALVSLGTVRLTDCPASLLQ